ncbi:MAG: hypothetical protein AB2556_26100 [Candidatus Thiodiazotropha sp.]
MANISRVEKIYSCHNGHVWPKDLHFPQSREVHIYEGDVWQAIREATRGGRLRSDSWAAKTDSSQSTSSCSRTAAPSGRKGSIGRLRAICAKLGNR